MKCINRTFLVFVLCFSFVLCGCSVKSYDIPYDVDTNISSFSLTEKKSALVRADAFASGLCVASDDIDKETIDVLNSESAGLFCVSTDETIYAKNIHKKMYPASVTKIMTALLAIEYGSPDDMLTASGNVIINESGAQVLGLRDGDRMSLDQALHALLMYSANDVAVMIAEYVSGSVEGFAELMNKRALELGATNTHFVNPHGLNNEEHYSTAYDLYLIFNECVKHEEFNKIIHTDAYSLQYFDRDGKEYNKELSTTNGYLSLDFSTPEGMSVVGGKTGTTGAAGSCLILLSNDSNNKEYISIVLHADDRNMLYESMSSMLSDV